MDLLAFFLLPVGLGLVGFVEPCTVGSSLLFLKYLEGKATPAKIRETIAFAITRALFIGALGALAALVGAVFLDIQRAFWIFLGAAYLGLGVLYVLRKQGVLMRTLGPGLDHLSETRGGETRHATRTVAPRVKSASPSRGRDQRGGGPVPCTGRGYWFVQSTSA